MAGLISQLQVVVFGAIVVATTLPATIVGRIGVSFIGLLTTPGEKRESYRALLGRICYRVMWLGWNCTIMFTPWLTVRYEGLEEFRESLKRTRGKPRLLIMNHTSFLDSFITVPALPFSEVADLKTMAAGFLFKTFGIAALCEGCNHLAVPFKSNTEDDFSIDKEVATDIQAKMEAHVRAGGIGSWWPEGTVNPNPSKLKTFRAGGFSIATKLDCEVWCLCYVGNAKCWPKKESIGGHPANIGVKAFRLCESTFKLAEQAAIPEGTDPSRAKATYIANYAQEKMQAEIDAMAAAGWVSVVKGDDANNAGEKKQN